MTCSMVSRLHREREPRGMLVSRPTEKLMKGLSGVKIIPSECAAVVLELKKRPRPRSPSLTTAVAVTNTLAGLMSVWVDGWVEGVDAGAVQCCLSVAVATLECYYGNTYWHLPLCMTLLECMCSSALHSWTKYLLCVCVGGGGGEEGGGGGGVERGGGREEGRDQQRTVGTVSPRFTHHIVFSGISCFFFLKCL